MAQLLRRGPEPQGRDRMESAARAQTYESLASAREHRSGRAQKSSQRNRKRCRRPNPAARGGWLGRRRASWADGEVAVPSTAAEGTCGDAERNGLAAEFSPNICSTRCPRPYLASQQTAPRSVRKIIAVLHTPRHEMALVPAMSARKHLSRKRRPSVL